MGLLTARGCIAGRNTERKKGKAANAKAKSSGDRKNEKEGGGKKGHNEEREEKKKGLRNLPSLITDPRMLQCCTGMTII